MMSDIKKLFKKDYLYWLIAVLIMSGVIAFMTLHIWGDYLNEITESVRSAIEFQNTHPEWEYVTGDAADLAGAQIPFDLLKETLIGILGIAFAAQTVKLLLQETKNRAEVLNLFPVKSSSRLTYHYVSGLLFIGVFTMIQMVMIRLNLQHVEEKTGIIFEGVNVFWSYAAKTMIVFMLQYSLLILCRKLSNHVVGTIFTFIVTEWAMQISAGYCLGMYWNNLTENRIQNWIFWIIVTFILTILSYIADQKKDYARNGFYAFPIVHWIIMGVIFGEVCYVFYYTYENVPKVVSTLLVIATSLLITTGVHFLTKPKSCKKL